MTDEDLKARLRDGVPCFDPDAVNDEGSFYIDDANETMCEAADRITALTAAGDRLAEVSEHHHGCRIIPCDCGYTEAMQAWRELTND